MMDDKLIEQMRHVVMLLTERNMLGNFTHVVAPAIREKAIEILQVIDPPVDPDLLAAREICIDMTTQVDADEVQSIRSGALDDHPAVTRIVAGIKFGRAHALSDLAKLPDDRERAIEIIHQIVPPNEMFGDWVTRTVLRGIAYGRAQLEPQRDVPPIEQDLIDAREIVGRIVHLCSPILTDRDGIDHYSNEYRSGAYDEYPSVQFVLTALQDRRKP